MTGAPFWQFYLDHETSWDVVLDALRGAKKSIDFEQYIVEDDDVGKMFLAVLKERAEAGVKVRMLVDAVGSFGIDSKYSEALTVAGVQIIFFNSLIPWRKHNHTIWFFRDHRKLTIIDNELGFTGGICISDKMAGWRDTLVKIEGSVVKEMTERFEEMWGIAEKKRRFFGRKFTMSGKGGSSFRYVPNSPLPHRRFLYYEILQAIRGAQKTIFLTTPYFIPSRKMLRALRNAAHRGVSVQIILPYASDQEFVDAAGGIYFSKLLAAGVKIFRYRGRMIHAKTISIDGTWGSVGSLNFDNVSFRYNFEANIVSTDTQFVSELETHFINDRNHSEELTLFEWRKRPLSRRVLEILTWPIRSFL